ncbi:hypothetical protein LUZ60_001392 [Juncus effusus]|nr:hypothetical protein LUZ60_001392 [Juncus effusus]
MYPSGDAPFSVFGSNADFGGASSSAFNQATILDGQEAVPFGEGPSNPNGFVDTSQALGGSENNGDDDYNNSQPDSEFPDDLSDEEETSRSRKKKKYHRHTPHQIQILEGFFNKCAHPDEKQRRSLSREVSMTPQQVKFWFQNKRNQVKTQNERNQNLHLKNENEKLKVENMNLREALESAYCPNCGGGPVPLGEMSFDEQQLRSDNQQLKHQIERLSAVLGNIPGVQMLPNPLLTMNGRVPILQIAVAAMEELMNLAQCAQPLWIPSPDGLMDTLNESEYVQMFPTGPFIRPNGQGVRSEGTRATAIVMMECKNVIQLLMNENMFSTFFPGIVSMVRMQDIYFDADQGNYDGALKTMMMECQALTPLVPRRESIFMRYCKQHSETVCVVADVFANVDEGTMGCKRRPSGCILQELPNGLTKVTWIEHVEADDSNMNMMYKSVVNSGIAFGARRWVSTLERQCQLLASAVPDSPAYGMPESQMGKRNVVKLVERIVTTFCTGITGSPNHDWSVFAGTGTEDDIKVTSRRSGLSPGRPSGVVLCASVSFWLPVSIMTAFEFLSSEASQNEWNEISAGCPNAVRETAQIACGREPNDNISILRLTGPASNEKPTVMLQQSCFDPTGAYVIYSPIDRNHMNLVISGKVDPFYVPVLPSGYAVLPDPNNSGVNGDGSSLLTVGFQIMLNELPNQGHRSKIDYLDFDGD